MSITFTTCNIIGFQIVYQICFCRKTQRSLIIGGTKLQTSHSNTHFAEREIYQLTNFAQLGLSDLELEKSIVDTILDIQQLKEDDKAHILTTINALLRDAKARNTYA